MTYSSPQTPHLLTHWGLGFSHVNMGWEDSCSPLQGASHILYLSRISSPDDICFPERSKVSHHSPCYVGTCRANDS